MDITLRVDMAALRVGYKKAGAKEFSRQNRKLLWFLEALTRCNVLWLEANSKTTPLLYDAGVRYREESMAEAWLDIPHVLGLGFGDCEDLAAWRTAELRARGVKAKPFLKWYNRPGDGITLYHVQVRHPNGTIEDPSKELGMKGRV